MNRGSRSLEALRSMIYQKSCLDLLNVIPGDRKTKILVDCEPSVSQAIDNIATDFDTLIIECEIWNHDRVDLINDSIVNHPKLKNATVVIATLGYEHVRLGPRTFKVSWNHFYNQSQILNKKQVWSTKPYNLHPNTLCLNGRDAVHWIMLGHRLHQQGLLKNLIFSQGKLTVPLANDLLNIQGLDQYLSMLPITADVAGYYNDHCVGQDFYFKTYCNIVTESEIQRWPAERNVPVHLVTEKSYKPFFAGQIPVLIAGPGHIQYLEKLGFDMFTELLPAGYDVMSTKDKIESVVDFVQRGNDFVEDYYFSNLTRLQHNFELAMSGRPWQQILTEIRDFLN